MANSLPDSKGFRIAGACKKVHIINPAFAIAWTGSMLSARSVIRDIHQAFAIRHPTFFELQEFLSKYTHYAGNFTVHIIGWLINKDAVCFRWNSQWPTQLFPAEEHIDGFGEEHFRKALEPEGYATAFSPGPLSFRSAELFFLATCSKPCAIEQFSGDTLKNAFGYCYEIALFSDRGFQYVSDVTYLIWLIRRIVSGGYEYTLMPKILKYRNEGDAALVQVNYLKGAPYDVDVCDFVSPIYEHGSAVNLSAMSRLPLTSEFYCCFLRCELTPENVITGPLAIHHSDKSLFQHELRGGEDFWTLHMNVVVKRFDLDGILRPS